MNYSQHNKPKKEEKKKAVALVYEPGTQAPQVVATGKGLLAEKIIETAKESDVPLYKDTDLTNTLMNLDIGDCIPPELYGVVAEILVYVDRMDKIRAKLERNH
ncbi:MAG: EscU/YscU/HrcU family type III secretion system export apparatus switch protein [Wujia sp.]